MRDPAAIEIKAFVPARDFQLSKSFYQERGFTVAWSSEGLAYIRHGATSFLLQEFPSGIDNYAAPSCPRHGCLVVARSRSVHCREVRHDDRAGVRQAMGHARLRYQRPGRCALANRAEYQHAESRNPCLTPPPACAASLRRTLSGKRPERQDSDRAGRPTVKPRSGAARTLSW